LNQGINKPFFTFIQFRVSKQESPQASPQERDLNSKLILSDTQEINKKLSKTENFFLYQPAKVYRNVLPLRCQQVEKKNSFQSGNAVQTGNSTRCCDSHILET
jgi:hypothetical protein